MEIELINEEILKICNPKFVRVVKKNSFPKGYFVDTYGNTHFFYTLFGVKKYIQKLINKNKDEKILGEGYLK